MEGIAASLSPLYPSWTKGQERLVELDAGVAESRALKGGWGGAASDAYFAEITDVAFCVISAKFASCR